MKHLFLALFAFGSLSVVAGGDYAMSSDKFHSMEPNEVAMSPLEALGKLADKSCVEGTCYSMDFCHGTNYGIRSQSSCESRGGKSYCYGGNCRSL